MMPGLLEAPAFLCPLILSFLESNLPETRSPTPRRFCALCVSGNGQCDMYTVRPVCLTKVKGLLW